MLAKTILLNLLPRASLVIPLSYDVIQIFQDSSSFLQEKTFSVYREWLTAMVPMCTSEECGLHSAEAA